MKRKKTNITTALLRSASSKRSRRKPSLFSMTHDHKENSNHISSTNAFTTDLLQRHPTKNKVGSASKRAYFCHGCNKEFCIYSSIQMFINKHLIGNQKCMQVFPKCICQKIFYDKKRLKAHQSQKPKNTDCYKEYSHEITDTKFNTSKVAIPPQKKSSISPIDVPNNLAALQSLQDNLMITKKHSSTQANFQSTIKFHNMSIHNVKTSLPSNFSGHVTMDPKSLLLKKNVVFDGIYCQPTNDNCPQSPNIEQNNLQVIDSGNF